MLVVFRQCDVLGEIVDFTVDSGADITGLSCIFQDFCVLALFPADYRSKDLDAGTLRQFHHAIDHLIDALLVDLLTAFWAVRNADPCPEQTQIVINFRHRTDCGAWVFGGRLLVDGDGGRKPVDIIYIRFVHLPEKHTGIGAQALHIATLAFGIYRVECQARFSRAADTRNYNKLVAWDFHIDVFQVVFPCTFYKNAVLHGTSFSNRPSAIQNRRRSVNFSLLY